MKISFTTSMNNLDMSIGYGIAGYNIVMGMKNMGIEVPFQDPTAAVEFGFVMPVHAEWSNPDAYHILCFPWESSTIPSDWEENLSNADELWVTSSYVKRIVEDAGWTVTKVFEHGIDGNWKTIHRTLDGPMKFLMIGGEAPRKNSAMTWRAFREAFGPRDDVHLTVKSHSYTSDRVYDRHGNILGVPYDMYANMTNITKDLSTEEMHDLVESHHVMVYPSYGEGFGFIPLQGLASGMPTICTGGWAPYRQFLDDRLVVASHMEESFIPNLHPGLWEAPEYDSLVKSFKYAQQNFESLADEHYAQAPTVKRHYDWNRLTKEAFTPIVERFDVT